MGAGGRNGDGRRNGDGASTADQVLHGYPPSGGKYSSIDYPKATAGTTAWGINDHAEIVGDWRDNAGNIHGHYAVKQ
jgi:hypothetical protein